MLKPNNIMTYLTFNNEIYYIPADCSFTRSSAWETVERRSTDSTRTAQAITLLKKYGYQPKTYQLTFNLFANLNEQNMFDLLSNYEMLVGKEVQLNYSNYPFGVMVITDGTFSLNVDGIRGIAVINVSYNLRESTVVTTSSAINVKTI